MRLSHAKLSLANTSLYRERKILRFVIIAFEIKGDTRTRRVFQPKEEIQGGWDEERASDSGYHQHVAHLLSSQKGFGRPVLTPIQWGSPQAPFPVAFPAPLRLNGASPPLCYGKRKVSPLFAPGLSPPLGHIGDGAKASLDNIGWDLGLFLPL